MSEAQFDDSLCHAALVRWRWPKGFQCPDCECLGHCIVMRGTRTLYQCNACRKQTSVKAGRVAGFSKIAIAKLAGAAFAPGVHAVSAALRCFPAVTAAGCTHTPNGPSAAAT
jgi:hypothetical protein